MISMIHQFLTGYSRKVLISSRSSPVRADALDEALSGPVDRFGPTPKTVLAVRWPTRKERPEPNLLKRVARPARFEHATFWSVAINARRINNLAGLPLIALG